MQVRKLLIALRNMSLIVVKALTVLFFTLIKNIFNLHQEKACRKESPILLYVVFLR